MSFVKQPEYTGPVHIGCLNCATHHEQVAPLDTWIIGYGFIAITKDSVTIYDAGFGDWPEDETTIPRLQQFEDMAAADPDHDWRYTNYTPLHGEVYQRHGSGEWVLIESNMGFA